MRGRRYNTRHIPSANANEEKRREETTHLLEQRLDDRILLPDLRQEVLPLAVVRRVVRGDVVVVIVVKHVELSHDERRNGRGEVGERKGQSGTEA